MKEGVEKVCGVSKCVRRNHAWWWNGLDVRNAIKEKRTAFAKWRRTRTVEDFESYKLLKRNAKRVIAKAIDKEAKEQSRTLMEMSPSDRMKQTFRLAKAKAKDKRDVASIKCVKNKDGELKVTIKDRLDVWKGYAEELLNKENAWVNDLVSTVNEGPVKAIDALEIRNAIKGMKHGKAPGPSGIPIEVIKICGCEDLLVNAANAMMDGRAMPESWTKSILIPLYKGKGDAKECSNYRSVKLLEHGMKVIERVFERRLRQKVDINEMQLGFMPGRGTIDGIFAIRQLMEKFRAVDRRLYMVFVDLEKAFDRVPRDLIWWALRRKGVIEREIAAIAEMYRSPQTAVRLDGEFSNYFTVNVGVHQGSILSPLLFIIVVDEITKHLKTDLREFLYADDLVLIGDSWEEVAGKYVSWKSALESKGLKVNVNKTKAMSLGGKLKAVDARKDPCAVCGKRVMRNAIQCTQCEKWVHKRCTKIRGSITRVQNFECSRCRGELIERLNDPSTIRLGEDDIEVVNGFSYLGDTISTDGEASTAVTARIRSAWKKFKEISGMLCVKNVSLQTKGELYKACVRSVMCYGAECWALKRKMSTDCKRQK